MASISFRALSTLITVAVGVGAVALWGDTWYGKLIAGAVVAGLIALVEWLYVWLPRRWAWARKLLDARAVWEDAWIQDVTDIYGSEGPLAERVNRWGIFVITFRGPNVYRVDGTAYDPKGHAVAKWWSEGMPSFSPDGMEITYVWDGSVAASPDITSSPDRTGLTKMTLTRPDAGTGRVDHVASNRRLEFKVHRITKEWLGKHSLTWTDPSSLADPSERDELAKKLAVMPVS